MNIDIRFTQRKHLLDKKRIIEYIERVTRELDVDFAEASVTFLNDKRMSLLNKQYMNESGPTDVLSFPQYEGEVSEVRKQLEADHRKGNPVHVGDIIISVETIWNRTNNNREAFYEDILTVVIHGFLHLLGYDHYDDETTQRMELLTHKLRDQLSRCH